MVLDDLIKRERVIFLFILLSDISLDKQVIELGNIFLYITFELKCSKILRRYGFNTIKLNKVVKEE